MSRDAKPGRRLLAYILPCLLASIACLIYPIYVIRPFRAQGPRELAAALAVTRYRPPVMAACAILAAAALVWYWRRETRWFRRIASAAGVLTVLAAGLLSRVNVYELMFHPLDRPTFSAADAAKLDGDEKAIVVRIGGAARAYPIRIISYHHIVNDVLDGVPIVATY